MKVSRCLVPLSNQTMSQQYWLFSITLYLIWVILLKRFQGQVAQDYIRSFLGTVINRLQASPEVKYISSPSLEVVGVCVVCGLVGFGKLQKRNSQALMSSSTSPSSQLIHEGTSPKAAPRTELAALLRAASLSQTITDRESTACRREALK